ncbi:hypothetical protein GCM10009665_26030 [Kitasatospora nipponensis]|uniref:HTH luxR-type domain-containing protein n=1 Tax=Kitasatospora nipponensis TaxID=258049 RepID=A0ABN1W420_9ACTN
MRWRPRHTLDAVVPGVTGTRPATHAPVQAGRPPPRGSSGQTSDSPSCLLPGADLGPGVLLERDKQRASAAAPQRLPALARTPVCTRTEGAVIRVLSVLGLEPETEAVYAALLGCPQADLSDLLAITQLTEPVVRAALDHLVDRSFARPSRDNPDRLRAVSPQVALDMIIRRQEADLARRSQKLAANRAAAAEAMASYGHLTPNVPVNGTERLVDMDTIEARLEILATEMKRECLSVMPGGAQSQASLDASRPLDANALGRGMAILTLYQNSVRNDPATYAYAKWLTDSGGEVRTAPVLPPRMLLFDREVALVPIDPGNTRAGALCTREPGIVASLASIYDQAWDTAVPLGAAATRDTNTGLAQGETELLALLAGGMTDEAAAKRLGIGLRTVRRHMAGIMERLDAGSRFEAGIKAAQRGWL